MLDFSYIQDFEDFNNDLDMTVSVDREPEAGSDSMLLPVFQNSDVMEAFDELTAPVICQGPALVEQALPPLQISEEVELTKVQPLRLKLNVAKVGKSETAKRVPKLFQSVKIQKQKKRKIISKPKQGVMPPLQVQRKTVFRICKDYFT